MQETELCRIAKNYRTDKVPAFGHSYTPFYFELFKDIRNSVESVLEIGVGNNEGMTHVPDYIPGASLMMWRDFFPNAFIWGVDIDPSVLFQEDRIFTLLCNQSDPDQIKEVMRTVGDVNIVIDDGSHDPRHQVLTAVTIFPYIKEGSYYIIEDSPRPDKVSGLLKDYSPEVHKFSKRHKQDNLIVMRK